jgi:mRNA interferase MazF
MIHEGQIVLFRFPQTDQFAGKLRPAVVLRKLPGPYDDWLICMISSQTSQAIAGFDEVISADSVDFQRSGLKMDSVIRIARMAVVQRGVLVGAVGEVGSDRLSRMRSKLADWMRGA